MVNVTQNNELEKIGVPRYSRFKYIQYLKEIDINLKSFLRTVVFNFFELTRQLAVKLYKF